MSLTDPHELHAPRGTAYGHFNAFSPPSARRHGVPDPGQVIAHLCVDARLLSQSASVSPRHNSLQLPLAHQRTPRVALQGHRAEGESEPSWICWISINAHVSVLVTWQESFPPSR